MGTRTELLRKMVKRKGVLYVLMMFAAGPLVLALAAAGRAIVAVGRWMQDVVGA